MRYSLVRDQKIRDKFKDREDGYRALRALYFNNFISPELRELARERLLKNGGGLITKIRNRCVLTGRSRGIVKDYKISRLTFKELAGSGLLVGVKKKSW
jgi:small subunit ribosomal protein S14